MPRREREDTTERELRYQRMCFAKVRYASKGDANEAAIAMTRTHRASYSAYECPFCHTWHIGHNPKRGMYVGEHRHEAYLAEMRRRKWKREEDRKKRPKKGQKKRDKTRVDNQYRSEEVQDPATSDV